MKPFIGRKASAPVAIGSLAFCQQANRQRCELAVLLSYLIQRTKRIILTCAPRTLLNLVFSN